MAKTIEITDERRTQRAPNFTLPATNALEVTLYKFAGRKRPVLFFPVSLDDESSKLFARNLAALRDELDGADAVFLPIVDADGERVRAWANENAGGVSVLMDADSRVRKKYYEYVQVDAAHALLVLLDLYCAPLVYSHAANAVQLMSPAEMQKWLNVLVNACSE